VRLWQCSVTVYASVHPNDDLSKLLSASEKLKSFRILKTIEYTRDERRNPVLRDKLRCGLEVRL